MNGWQVCYGAFAFSLCRTSVVLQLQQPVANQLYSVTVFVCHPRDNKYCRKNAVKQQQHANTKQFSSH